MPGQSTNDTEPEVSGTAEPFSTVTLFANGVAVGSVVADALGNWSITAVGTAVLTHALDNCRSNWNLSIDNDGPRSRRCTLVTRRVHRNHIELIGRTIIQW